MEESVVPQPPVFRVGICMAGAVSAGAYTAGVMDYLLEALQAYEKKRGTAGYPSHKIEIPIIGGASAGGMTSIITAAAFQQGITPVKEPLDDILKEREENILYHSWVDLTDRDMFAKMLDTDDIRKAEVVSALNCQFIDKVANRVIRPEVPKNFSWKPLPSFFADSLKVFTTLSNLQGLSYNMSFKAGGNNVHRPYYMQLHNDYACFQLLKEGTPPDKGWMTFNVKTGENSRAAIDAAMATGAFPIGLRPRLLSRTQEMVNNNPLYDKDTQQAIKISGDPYVTLNVDGGMINNEPFDKVREQLNKISKEENNTWESYKTFKSTVLMIAPFPSTKPATISLVDKLLQVAGLTLSAMISQMRSKASQIKSAMDDDCAGQYLIDPSRIINYGTEDEVVLQGERAIACGALGGFSGFLNKEFRVHDFFLGRHNCKIFLRDYFTIPEEFLEHNEIFKKGYENADQLKFRGKDNSWQIIPIIDEVDDPHKYDFPKINFSSGTDWPQQRWADIEIYTCAMKKRVEKIILNLVSYSRMNKFLLFIGTRVLIRGLLTQSIMNTIKEELTKWNLLIDFQPITTAPDLINEKDVKFESSITTVMRQVDVLIQGYPVPSAENKITFHQPVSGNKLVVIYQFYGTKGSAYTINYSCTSNGVLPYDANSRLTINGIIEKNGYKEVTLSIPLTK